MADKHTQFGFTEIRVHTLRMSRAYRWRIRRLQARRTLRLLWLCHGSIRRYRAARELERIVNRDIARRMFFGEDA